MLTRERPRTPARKLLPPPAPLSSLRDALARRADIFGPVDLDEVPAASRGPWQALGDLARRVVDLMEPPRSAPLPALAPAFARRRAVFEPVGLDDVTAAARSDGWGS